MHAVDKDDLLEEAESWVNHHQEQLGFGWGEEVAVCANELVDEFKQLYIDEMNHAHAVARYE